MHIRLMYTSVTQVPSLICKVGQGSNVCSICLVRFYTLNIYIYMRDEM